MTGTELSAKLCITTLLYFTAHQKHFLLLNKLCSMYCTRHLLKSVRFTCSSCTAFPKSGNRRGTYCRFKCANDIILTSCWVLLQHIFRYYACPSIMVSNKGPWYTLRALLWKSFMEKFRKLILDTVRTSQRNSYASYHGRCMNKISFSIQPLNSLYASAV